MNISSIGTIAITILVAAVILGLGGTILEKITGTQTDALATTPNQSFNWPGNDTLTSFTLGELGRINTGSVILYCNNSLFTVGENYTVSSSGVNIINLTTGGIDFLDTCSYNMTYSYNFGSSARNASQFGIVGVGTMAEFIPTIAIIAMAAIVLGIIMFFFGRKKDGEVG